MIYVSLTVAQYFLLPFRNKIVLSLLWTIHVMISCKCQNCNKCGETYVADEEVVGGMQMPCSRIKSAKRDLVLPRIWVHKLTEYLSLVSSPRHLHGLSLWHDIDFSRTYSTMSISGMLPHCLLGYFEESKNKKDLINYVLISIEAVCL